MENKGQSQVVANASGLSQIWRLWRHCCCRYGWYPLIVAPVVTFSCLLDLYSSFDCEFLNVEVGFTPLNPAWNESKATFGLFQYQSGSYERNEESRFWEVLVEGCHSYSEDFEVAFVDGDRTWQVTRIMAFISGGSSIVAVLVSWLLVILPLPASFLWPGVILPSLLIAFLCQGSKFLFLDTAICQSSLWYPTGVDSLPQKVHNCSLGKSSYFCISAAVSLCICLLLVCLNSPQKRKLDKSYGKRTPHVIGLGGTNVSTSLDEDNDAGLHTDQKNNNVTTKSALLAENKSKQNQASDGIVRDLSKNTNPEKNQNFESGNKCYLGDDSEKDLEKGSVVKERDDVTLLSKDSSNATENYSPDHTQQPLALSGNDTVEVVELAKHTTLPLPPSSPSKSPTRIVSQVRLSKAEKMEFQTHDDNALIEKCVRDLKKSFQKDGNNVDSCVL